MSTRNLRRIRRLFYRSIFAEHVSVGVGLALVLMAIGSFALVPRKNPSAAALSAQLSTSLIEQNRL